VVTALPLIFLENQQYVESVNEFVFSTFCLRIGTPVCVISNPTLRTTVGLHKTVSRGGTLLFLAGGGGGASYATAAIVHVFAVIHTVGQFFGRPRTITEHWEQTANTLLPINAKSFCKNQHNRRVSHRTQRCDL